MKLSIKFTKAKTISQIFTSFSYLLVFLFFVLITSTSAGLEVQATGLSESQLNKFAQNNILFYAPDGPDNGSCNSKGSSSSLCGSNTKEKLWTALRQYFDEVHAAAALGNILHEGGLNPLRWEYKAVNDGNPPTFDSRIDDWNKLYDGTYMKECYDSDFNSWYCIGVGDFAITSRLDEYLQYIKANEPDLFEYFKDPKYTYLEGDALITELGEAIHTRLVALETNYFVNDWIDPSIKKTFENYTDVSDAARYYSDSIMACDACHTDSEMNARAASAEKIYTELKGFSCTPSSSSSNVSTNNSCALSEFVWYPQFLEPWASVQYTVDDVTSTIGDDGCGPTAFAMLANMLLPQEITPADTIKVAADTGSILPGEGSYGELLTKNLAEHYGLQWEKLDSSSIDASMNDITQHLKDGWMIMTAGAGSVPYTSRGHYVGVRGIDGDGNWLLADSGHSEDVSRQPWKPEDVMTAGINPGNVYAIKTASGTACGVSYCKNTGSAAAGSNGVVGSVHEPSVDVPCDPRTIDLGTRDDAYYQGQQYSIRLCSIPNIPDRDGSGDGHDDGNIHVNSRVSGAFYSLAEEHKKRCGQELVASEGYRTADEQQYFWDLYQNGQGNTAAEPGYSNHQGGLAVDFDTNTYCSNDSSVVSGGWFEPEFLAKFNLQDGRSFGENWHIEAMEQ